MSEGIVNTFVRWVLQCKTDKSNNKMKISTVSEFILSKNEAIALDLGANIGNITQQMADAGAEVYAFEPNPYAFARLQDRFVKNPKVHCIQKAVLDKETKIPLYFHEFSDDDEVKWSVGSSLLDFKGNVVKEKKHLVETVDLANFILELDREIDLIKMDVEGVECTIINHIIDTGAIEKVKYMLVETHDHKIPELKEETDALRSRIKALGLEKKINLNWV
jgi:FkbM family methyltransferase